MPKDKALLRQGLILLIAYVMFISPEGFYQLSYASTDYNTPNRQITYTYDDNGSLTSKTLVDTNTQETLEVVTYEYNLQNRLAKTTTTPYENGQPQTQDAVTAEYKYDPDGIRVAKTVDGVTTDYLIDSYNHTGYSQVFVEKQDSSRTDYTIGSDVISQATDYDNPADLKYLLYDGQSSVRQLADSDGDALYGQSHYYDAYGNFIDIWSDEPASNLRYTGQQWDDSAQMYYLRARYYSPLNSRFNRIGLSTNKLQVIISYNLITYPLWSENL
jgi:RHS repeat-associated protein